jgi:hypothetical protein
LGFVSTEIDPIVCTRVCLFLRLNRSTTETYFRSESLNLVTNGKSPLYFYRAKPNLLSDSEASAQEHDSEELVRRGYT